MLTIYPASAQSIWSHNGSEMLLEANGSSRRFVYLKPRNGLSVQPGEVLFEGQRQGSVYSGTAYLFSERCGKIGYAVSGNVGAGDRSVQLKGLAPRRDINCNNASFFEDTLNFTYKSAWSATNAAPVTPGSATSINKNRLLNQDEILAVAKDLLSDQQIVGVEFIQRERECNFHGGYSSAPAYKIVSLYKGNRNAHIFDASNGVLLCAKDAM